MICFDVYLNDRRLCLAGVGDFGHLSQYLVWDRRRPEEKRRQAAREVRRELYLKLKEEFESDEAAA